MTSQKAITTAVLSLALLVGVFSLMPSPVKADFNPFNPLDPFCLFSCNNDRQNVTNTYTTSGSYNTNSYNSGTTYTAPVYAATPTYTYQSQQQISPLYVSCYSYPTSANIGTTVAWSSSVSGGNGDYYITWSGTDSLYGNGSQITKAYNYAGSKNASITVTSGGQTLSKNCAGSVIIYDNSGSYYNTPVYTYPPVYNPPVYYPPTTYYPISVSCSANTTYTTTGSYVTWTAYVTGGYSNYNTTYSWSGTDGLYGSQSAISTYYSNQGTKYAYVTVNSNGQVATAQCTNSVTVTSPYVYTQPVYGGTYSSNLGLQIACATDKVSTVVGSPVTWVVEAISPGNYYNNFTYAWTGTDGLTGNQSSIVKSYSTPGLKSAVVTVTAPNGQSQSKACTNTVTVKSATVAAKKPAVVAATPTPTPQVVYIPPVQTQTAAGLFSLQNVPWGWVAVLVILVLLGMIFYMLFNKKKI